jgi:hypothetical protein
MPIFISLESVSFLKGMLNTPGMLCGSKRLYFKERAVFLAAFHIAYDDLCFFAHTEGFGDFLQRFIVGKVIQRIFI